MAGKWVKVKTLQVRCLDKRDERYFYPIQMDYASVQRGMSKEGIPRTEPSKKLEIYNGYGAILSGIIENPLVNKFYNGINMNEADIEFEVFLDE